MQFVPREPVKNRMEQQIAPQTLTEFPGVARLRPLDRVQQGTVERVIDVPVPEMLRMCVELVNLTPCERVRQRTVEPIINPPDWKERRGPWNTPARERKDGT